MDMICRRGTTDDEARPPHFTLQLNGAELDEVLFGLANRQRVALSVHLRLNMISGANVSCHPGGCIEMQTPLITVLLLDEIGTRFNAQHFALDGVDALPCVFIALHEIRFSAFPFSTGVRFHTPRCLRDIGQAQA